MHVNVKIRVGGGMSMPTSAVAWSMQQRPSEQVDIRNMDLKHAADLGPLGGTEVLACTGLGSDCVQIDTAMLVVRIKLQVRCYKVNEQEKQGRHMQQASPTPAVQCNCLQVHNNSIYPVVQAYLSTKLAPYLGEHG